MSTDGYKARIAAAYQRGSKLPQRWGRTAEPTTPLESWEQRQLAHWLDTTGLLWIHVANEGKRTKRYGASLVAQGMKKGAPDNLVFDQPGVKCYRGMAIELKREWDGKPGLYPATGPRAGGVEPHERAMLESFARVGWYAAVAWGWKAAANAIATMYLLTPPCGPGRLEWIDG